MTARSLLEGGTGLGGQERIDQAYDAIVASYGNAMSDTHVGKNLEIGKNVDSTTHLVAMNEYRDTFRLTSALRSDENPPRCGYRDKPIGSFNYRCAEALRHYALESRALVAVAPELIFAMRAGSLRTPADHLVSALCPGVFHERQERPLPTLYPWYETT